MTTTTETTRLVNAYVVRSIEVVGSRVYRQISDGAEGIPERAMKAAIAQDGLGVLIVDVRTGEEWFTPVPAAVVRTYELFDIVWARGSRWSSYDTEAEAQAIVDRSAEGGYVERKTFEVTVLPKFASIYQPGFSERLATAEEIAAATR